MWKACELHSHTVHSDGAFTVTKLLEAAIKAKLDCIAITDHNTMAAHRSEALKACKEALEIETIQGCEMTTYYGHVLGLGLEEDVRWNDLGQLDGNLLFDRMHKAKGLVGVAHPFRNGYPVSTGTYFNYKEVDWARIDYIEVWHQSRPALSEPNIKAIDFWHEQLNKGQRMSGLTGRDWHGTIPDQIPFARTYLDLLPEDGKTIEDQVRAAIVSGKVVCSYGPMLMFSALGANGVTYAIGDAMTVGAEAIEVTIAALFENYSDLFHVKANPMSFVINSNKGMLAQGKLEVEQRLKTMITIKDVTWFKLEVYGMIENEPCMVAFTNPIYIK